MALDAYVMPLWRFKAGDFTPPIEATLGIKPTIISPAIESSPCAPWYLRLLAKIGIIEFDGPPPELSPTERRARAVQEVDALKAKLTKMTGIPIDWFDNGDVHYNKQFYNPSVLQAFAAWHDHREELPVFLPAPELRYDKHIVRTLPKPAKRRFPTLADHSLYTGYLIPVPFEGIHLIEPYKSWGDRELFHDVASTQNVMRELSDLLKFIATVPEVREEQHGSIPVADARWYAEELQRICALSIEQQLPVIFHG
jgi:hypothetical protein